MDEVLQTMPALVDGCTEDGRGAFDWAPPDDDIFAFITELMRSAGTYFYGRRM